MLTIFAEKLLGSGCSFYSSPSISSRLNHFLLAQVGPRPNNTGTLNNTHIQDFTFQNFVGVVRECVTVSYLPFGRNH
jgi:hypothetical protein